MKILLCHNHYQQPGGEDQSFAAEAWLLEANEHDVIRYTLHSEAIAGMGKWDVARRTFWSKQSYNAVRALIRRERPDVMHCTNTFPLISPAVYYAAKTENVPVVQSLRNYRLLCANGYFLRDGKVCEDCLGKLFPWRSVLHACYRDSRAASAVVAGMVGLHSALGTWQHQVTLYFTPTEFARRKHIAGGFPADRIAVKPNFVHPDPGVGDGAGGYALFVGRLSPEKGIETLLAAWEELRGRWPLKIVGDGPLAGMVKQAAEKDSSIEWLGQRPMPEVLSLIGDAKCLIMPSVWYETFGRTIVEAFAKGTPVIVSHMGAMTELVEDGQTGLLFEAGNANDLAIKVRTLLLNTSRLEHLRRNAREEYEARYTAQPNYEMLMEIYERAIRLHQKQGAATARQSRPKIEQPLL